MGLYREQDPLAALLSRETTRVLDCLTEFTSGRGARALSDARRILRALADAESSILYPAFRRVNLRLETQRLLEDSTGERDEQLAALDTLAHKRAARLRKLGAVALADLIQRHAQQHISLLIPVLASQLPRPLYRSIVQAFTARYEGTLEQPPRAHDTRPQRAVASNA